MEVSQIAQLDTHAVIGGGKAQAFEIAQSAEFFTVLSSTLYRDKKRAVIREVVCNAWDAHIVSGQKDRPVEILLSETELTIKDYGPGIPHNKIGQIYCVYGASTKVADENQTGGFGLGSKAPFAYSDHFTVTSCHEGLKSVYAISRGGAETDGKPDFRRMVAVQTEESGVTVTIPLRDRSDMMEFDRIVHQVVRQGGMKAKINANVVEGYDWEGARKQGFAVLGGHELRESKVYVLYGTVLYPLSTTDEDLTRMVNQLGYLTHSKGVVALIAPPNSVGVTPSRESLSYTERTKETLLRLGKRAYGMIDQAQRLHCKPAYLKSIEKSLDKWTEKPSSTLDSGLHFGTFTHDLKQIGIICATSRLDKLIPNKNKVARLHFAKKLSDRRRLLRRAAYRPCEPYNYDGFPRIDLFRWEMRIHMRLAAKVGLLKQVYVSQFSYDTSEKVNLTRADRDEFSREYPVIKRLFVAFNQRDAIKGISDWRSKERAKGKLGWNDRSAAVAIVLKRNQHNKLPEIRTLVKKYGFELKEMAVSKPPKREPKVEKTFLFHAFKDVDGYGNLTKSETLTTATHYVRAVRLRHENCVMSGLRAHKAAILEMFPDTAVAIDAKDEAKLRAIGAKNVLDVMAEELTGLMDRPDVQFAFAATNNLLFDYGNYHTPSRLIYEAARKNIRAALHFTDHKIRKTPTMERAHKIIRIIDDARGDMHRERHREMRKPLDEVLSNLNIKARIAFHKKISTKELNERHRYLMPLATTSFDVSDDGNLDLLLEMAAFFERRQQRLDRKNPNGNPAETQKEAA